MLKWSASNLQGISENEVIWESEKDTLDDLLKKRIYHLKDIEEEELFICNQSIPTKIQNSSNCGLVILSQSAEYLKAKKNGELPKEKTLNEDSNTLLKECIEKGYSKEGEMFDAYNLSKITVSVGIKSIVINKLDPLIILSHLLFDLPILIAYDASKNNSPALLKGDKAHWTSIKGFMTPINYPLLNSLSKKFNLQYNPSTMHEKKFNTLTHDESFNISKSNYLNNFLSKIENNKEDFQMILSEYFGELNKEIHSTSKLYLICKQSKSRYQAVWDYDSLIESNKNLMRPSEERKTGEWVIPETLENLNGKIILLY